MKNLKTALILVIGLAMTVFMVAGCNGGTAKTTASDTKAGVSTSPVATGKPKVALVLEGAISDMSWNANAYAGLMKVQALGAETKYVENVPVSSAADAIRTFAEDGYDVIFLASSSYQDVGASVVKDFPNIQFFIMNGTVAEDNYTAFAIQDAEQGYLMGALAALMSKSGKLGFIGGMPINPIINGAKGFAQGAKDTKADIEVTIENTGSFDDVSAAKELAKAMIGQGVDILCPMADQSSLGVIEAADEDNVKAIYSGMDLEGKAPASVIVSVLKDTSIAYEAAYKAYLAGEIPNEVLPMGVAQGVIYFSDFYQEVPEEIQTQMKEIQDKFAKGEIEINLD